MHSFECAQELVVRAFGRLGTLAIIFRHRLVGGLAGEDVFDGVAACRRYCSLFGVDDFEIAQLLHVSFKLGLQLTRRSLPFRVKELLDIDRRRLMIALGVLVGRVGPSLSDRLAPVLAAGSAWRSLHTEAFPGFFEFLND